MNLYIEPAPLSAALKIGSKTGSGATCTLSAADDLRLSIVGETAHVCEVIACEVEGPGRATVPLSLLSEAVRRVGGQGEYLLLKDTGRAIEVSCGRARTTVPTIDPVDVDADDGEVVATLALSAGELRTALDATVRCVSTDDSRHGLNGICLRGGQLMATDGHRGIMWALSVEGDGGRSLVARDSAAAMLAVLESCGDEDAAVLSWGEAWHTLTVGDVSLRTRAIDGKFPDIAAVTPKTDGPSATVYREEMIDALGVVEVATGYEQIAVVVRGDRLSQRSGMSDREATTTIRVEPSDDWPKAWGVRGRYMIEALRTCKGETVTLWMRNAQAPILVDGDDHHTRIVMPMRVD